MSNPIILGIDFGYNYSRVSTIGFFTIQRLLHMDKIDVPSNLIFDNNNFTLERNNTNLVNNIKIIKEIRKLINKKIPKIDNFEIKDNSKISDRIITIDKNDYSVSTIINKFIQLLMTYFSIKINFISLIVITIPAYFNDEQRKIIESSVQSIKQNKLKVILLEEPIAALINVLNLIKINNQNDNYLVLTFYEDLLDLSIISFDDNLKFFVKQPALFDDEFSLKNRFIRLREYCENKYFFNENEIKEQLYNNEKIINLNNGIQIKKIDLYKDLFDNCKKLLNKVNLHKKDIKKIIIIGNSEFKDKDICEYYFNCEVIFSKNEEAFVNGATKYAKKHEQNNNNLNTYRKSYITNELINRGNNYLERIRNSSNTQRPNKLFSTDNEINESIKDIKENNSKIDKLFEKVTETNSNLEKILKKLSEDNIKSKKSFEENKNHNSTVDSILIELLHNKNKNDEIIKQLSDNTLQNTQAIKIINEHNSKMESKFEQHFAKINELLNNVRKSNEKLNEKYKNMEEQYLNTTDGFNKKFKEIDEKLNDIKEDFNIKINGFNMTKKKETITAKNIENKEKKNNNIKNTTKFRIKK